MILTTIIEVPLWCFVVLVFLCGVALGKWLFEVKINYNWSRPKEWEATRYRPGVPLSGYQPNEPCSPPPPPPPRSCKPPRKL